MPELTRRRNTYFSSISIAEGEEWPTGASVKAHAVFQRKSGQFINVKIYVSVHSMCTSDTSSSLPADLLLLRPNIIIKYAQYQSYNVITYIYTCICVLRTWKTNSLYYIYIYMRCIYIYIHVYIFTSILYCIWHHVAGGGRTFYYFGIAYWHHYYCRKTQMLHRWLAGPHIIFSWMNIHDQITNVAMKYASGRAQMFWWQISIALLNKTPRNTDYNLPI